MCWYSGASGKRDRSPTYSEAPMLPCLLDQIGADEMVASVSGVGAYDTKDCHGVSRGVVRTRSSRRAAMPSRGKIDHLAPQPVTPSWTPHAGLAERS
jgi:hypothetical protein